MHPNPVRICISTLLDLSSPSVSAHKTPQKLDKHTPFGSAPETPQKLSKLKAYNRNCMFLLEITSDELIGTLFKGGRLAILEISLLTYSLYCFLISVCSLFLCYCQLPIERCPFPFSSSELIDIHTYVSFIYTRCDVMRSHMTLRSCARFLEFKHGLVVVVTLCRLYYLVCALNSVTLHGVRSESLCGDIFQLSKSQLSEDCV